MTGPTAEQLTLLAELEHHAGSLSRLLGVLRTGLKNAKRAKDARTIRAINAEIAYTIERLAEVQARRDALNRQLGGKGRG